MITLKNISFSYGERPILTDFSLTVPDGKCVCLKGPSGCGKTTVLRLVLGLLTPDSGEIEGCIQPSVVFQEDRLIDGLSLLKNVTLPLEKSARDVAIQLLCEANLGEAIGKKARNCSGGMKRRAAIVRAVAFNGDALILDEPFNGIDPENKQIMANIIKREFLQKGKPVLMVSHIDSDAKLLDAETIEI